MGLVTKYQMKSSYVGINKEHDIMALSVTNNINTNRGGSETYWIYVSLNYWQKTSLQSNASLKILNGMTLEKRMKIKGSVSKNREE